MKKKLEELQKDDKETLSQENKQLKEENATIQKGGLWSFEIMNRSKSCLWESGNCRWSSLVDSTIQNQAGEGKHNNYQS